MPIYSYRCETCAFHQDVLRKMSDPLLVDCPSCGAPTFVKQVTAAGFQLKGSGWYVTDFRNPAGKEGKSSDKGDKGGDSDGAKSDSKEGAAASGTGPAASESGAAAAKPSAPSTASQPESSSAKAGPAPTTGSS